MIEGPLDFASINQWLPRADELSSQDSLDLSGITRADSCGVSFLLELTRRAAARGRTLRLQKLPQSLQGLLEFLQLEAALNIDR